MDSSVQGGVGVAERPNKWEITFTFSSIEITRVGAGTATRFAVSFVTY